MESRNKSAASRFRKEALPNKEFSFYKAFEKIIGGLSVRSQDIARERFGVGGKPPKTLEEIGGEYDITRERVRQIIRSVMKDVQAKKNQAFFGAAVAYIESTLEENSGIMKESDLLQTLGGGDPKEEGAIRFFLECFSGIHLVKETEEIERSYVLDSFSLEEWTKAKNAAITLFKKQDRLLGSDELSDQLARTLAAKQRGKTLFHFLAVAKEIQCNVFGKWGLASWSDVQPKGTREKAYLILKMSGKPLHFREITKLIDQYGLQKSKRKTHPQTVHNELIKDKRFVLVGRGTYALSEWGYKRGTVREVLEDILKENNQPMKRSEIIKKVLEVRQVKTSTIIINLNTFFAKVSKDAYTLPNK
jgi:DNA-directed RNA polymerase delta subunit